MSVEIKVKLPSMEQAIAKAEGYVKSKAQSRGTIIGLNTFACNLGMIGATDIYTVEGNVEVETNPEQRIPAEKDILGRIKKPEQIIARRFVSAIWKVQLKLEDLSTIGFDLKF